MAIVGQKRLTRQVVSPSDIAGLSPLGGTAQFSVNMDREPGSGTRTNEGVLVRYCAAALLVILAIAVGLRLSLGVETAFVLCFGGIVLSALYAGLAPAIFALLIAAAALKFFFLQPHYELLPTRAGLDDTIRLGMFMMIALITSCFAAGCRRTIQA